jgi:Ca2+-binding EF-hand superfamily protein
MAQRHAVRCGIPPPTLCSHCRRGLVVVLWDSFTLAFYGVQLDFHEFAKVLQAEWQLDPHSEHGMQLARVVFDSFNTNRGVQLDGLVQQKQATQIATTTIDLQEFVYGMATLLTSGTSYRFRMMFSVLDVDGSNTLNVGEFAQCCLHATGQNLFAAQRMAVQVVKLIDADGTGTVTVDELCVGIDRLPALAQLLTDPRQRLSQKSLGEIVTLTRQDADAEACLTPQIMRNIFELLDDGTVSKSEFKDLMQSQLSVNDPLLCGFLFNAMDSNGSGSLNVRELIFGLSQWSSPDPKTRLAFYFDLFDGDHSGKLSLAELEDALRRMETFPTESLRQHVGAASTEVDN